MPGDSWQTDEEGTGAETVMTSGTGIRIVAFYLLPRQREKKMAIDRKTPSNTTPTTAEKTVNPVENYGNPVDVVRDPTLSNAEKTKALDNWENDAHRLQTADDEGLAGGEPDRLIEVVEAKKSIGAKTVTTQHK